MTTMKTQFFCDDDSAIKNDNAMYISIPLLQYPLPILKIEKSTRMNCRNASGTSSFFRLSAFYRHSLLRDDINLSHSLLNVLKKKLSSFSSLFLLLRHEWEMWEKIIRLLLSLPCICVKWWFFLLIFLSATLATT